MDISIFNTLGQKLATLVSNRQPAEYYTVHWDASGLTSGAYLYRLEAGDPFDKLRTWFYTGEKVDFGALNSMKK